MYKLWTLTVSWSYTLLAEMFKNDSESSCVQMRLSHSDSLDVHISYRPFFWLPFLLANNTDLTVFEMSPEASSRPLSKTEEVETFHFSRREKEKKESRFQKTNTQFGENEVYGKTTSMVTVFLRACLCVIVRSSETGYESVQDKLCPVKDTKLTDTTHNTHSRNRIHWFLSEILSLQTGWCVCADPWVHCQGVTRSGCCTWQCVCMCV